MPAPAPRSRPQDPPDVAVVGAAIVDSLDRPTTLLAARRTEPPALAGRWELPGGKVDPGESREVALHREIAEELGVRIELGPPIVGPLPDGRWRLSPRHVISVWLARAVDPDPRPLEDHDRLLLLRRAELFDVDWLEGDRPIVEAIAPRLGERPGGRPRSPEMRN